MKRTTIDLLTLTERERQVFYSGYRSGIAAGIPIGYQQREDDEAAAWRKMAARIRRVASEPPFSVLAERRGDHERAAAARERERAWRVAS